ncbi:unnamed protein product [Thelazia callipaeda]|uniref:Uncharacterized protein n=1 Tax=Thelazia callipaeda TaxID=103827 RepID=A0A0N5CV89_THECL|nr:unnamed protein product [Thelazia callipaeda]
MVKFRNIAWNKPNEGYGKVAFAVSLFFSCCSAGSLFPTFMLWTEKYQKERRQAGVKEYLRELQRKQNMAKYEEQKKRLDED